MHHGMPEPTPEHTLYIQFMNRWLAFKKSREYVGTDHTTMHIKMTWEQWLTFGDRYKDISFANDTGMIQHTALGGLKVDIYDDESETGLYVDDVMIGEPFHAS
jgi:hypothetical protein